MTEPNNTIYPTHSCFDDAMEFMEFVAKEYKNEDLSFLKLVHGTVKGDDGLPHAHAWVEDSGTEVAIYAGVLKCEKVYFYTPIEEFYSGWRVQETTKYTIKETVENNLRTIHFGPWEQKYKDLVADDKHGNHTFIVGGTMRIGTLGKLPRKETMGDARKKTAEKAT